MKESFTTVNGIAYIDPSCFLQFLEGRAKLIAEKTAEPGLDALATERLRGQRLELLSQLKQIQEATNGR